MEKKAELGHEDGATQEYLLGPVSAAARTFPGKGGKPVRMAARIGYRFFMAFSTFLSGYSHVKKRAAQMSSPFSTVFVE